MENINSEQNENNDMTQSINSISDKECIEDKYNKLRGFAVKLKKKVSDLSEQLQHLESEKQKLIAEKDELHNKFVEITESAKKVQTIQLEYDKIQDKMEQCKMENKKLIKNIETLVSQNTSLKESLFHEKDVASSLSAKVEYLSVEKNNLESQNKQFAEEIKKLKNELKAQVVIQRQREKEFEETKSNLDVEINAHKSTKSQLDALKKEHASTSVLSLEVENYEKSIREMKAKCAEETSKCESLEKSIDKYLEKIVVLNNKISELQDDYSNKGKEVENWQQKYEDEKIDCQKKKDEINDMQKKIINLTEQLQFVTNDKKALSEKLEKLIIEKNDIVKENGYSKECNEKLIKDLTAEVTKLYESLEQSKQETENLRQEFEGYKLRAQSVLRTKESSTTKNSKGKNMIELEGELEHVQFQNDMLKEKLDNCRQKMESMSNELIILKEEKDHALESRKEMNEKLTILRQEYRLLMEQNKFQEIKIQQMHNEQKKEIERIHSQYKLEINELKEQHQNEILDFKSKYETTFTLSSKNESIHSGHNKTTESMSDANTSSRISAPLVEREECEGSESIDSCSHIATNDQRHSLMPLDELLNSTDDFNNCERKMSTKVSRQELEVCEHRVKHLTVLLADAERDIAKLTQQNELLKEDIRRQQRSAEREQHANNFEYLKNVVFKFVTLKNGDERSHLIPVLTTILKLSPEETHKLNAVAGVPGKSWISNIPGWYH